MPENEVVSAQARFLSCLPDCPLITSQMVVSVPALHIDFYLVPLLSPL